MEVLIKKFDTEKYAEENKKGSRKQREICDMNGLRDRESVGVKLKRQYESE